MMLHLMLLVYVLLAVAERTMGQTPDWSVDAPAVVPGLPPADTRQFARSSRRPPRWWPTTGLHLPNTGRSAGSRLAPLWCSTNKGERCDSALEAALREIFQIDDDNPSLASNFRLLVPVPMSQDNRLSKDDRDLKNHDRDFQKDEGGQNKYYRDIAKYATELAKHDLYDETQNHDHDMISTHDVNYRGFNSHDQELHDRGYRWMKINWNGIDDQNFRPHDDRDVLSHQNDQLYDPKKPLFKINLYGLKLNDGNSRNTKMTDDDTLFDTDQAIKLNNLKDQNVNLHDPKKHLLKINLFGLKLNDRNNVNENLNNDIKLADNGRDFQLKAHDNHDFLNDQSFYLQDYKTHWDKINLFDPNLDDRNNLNNKLTDDVFVENDRGINLNDYGNQNVLGDHNAKEHDLNNRFIKMNLYGTNLNDRYSKKLKDDDSDRELKSRNHDNRDVLHDHNIRLVDQDNDVVDDIIMHDHELLVVDEETPRHQENSKKESQEVEDGPFSEIPSSEFTLDSVEHQPSVKKDLSTGTLWLDSVCQSMEISRDDREDSSVVNDDSQLCGMCCQMQRKLAELAKPLSASRLSPNSFDLTRLKSEFSKESIPDDLHKMLDSLLASRRVDVPILNGNYPNRKNEWILRRASETTWSC